MQTTIQQINTVEFELVIDAPAQELAPHVEDAIRKQRHRVQVKGFRPGKVPVPMLKKMYGESLVMDAIEKVIQDAFEDEVIEPRAHKVIGSPDLTKLDYKLDGDLHAVLRFGVQPEITLADLTNEELLLLKHVVNPEDIDKRIQSMLLDDAKLDDPSTERAITGEDYVVIDMQEWDAASNTPVVGSRDEDLSFFMDDERLREGLRDALLGKKAGDIFQVNLPNEDASDEEEAKPLLVDPAGNDTGAQRTKQYEVTVKQVQVRTLPILDEETIKKFSGNEASTEEELRDHIAKRIERAWKRQSRELLEGEVVMRMLELHPFEVPTVAINLFLGSFLEDMRRRNNGRLPDDLDSATFNRAYRPEAKRQARWMILRDHVIEQEKLEVTDEDINQHYLELADGNEEMAGAFRKYYEASGMNQNLDQQLISKKVVDVLVDRFKKTELESEAYAEAVKARRARQTDHDLDEHDHDHGHDHDHDHSHSH